LRLAVLLHRARSDNDTPKLRLSGHKRRLTLKIPARWLARHPLTLADLQREVEYLKDAGIILEY
jgi:exopolyphosphatase / guanosine-5'-triphosphate,3'-diphosphate pyrophosphatase